MSKSDVISRLTADRLIALIKADTAADIRKLTEALSEGGISNWEIPMICPAIPDFLAEVAPDFPDFQFGISTVVDTETARRGIIAGARFISTPALRPEVILLCRRYQVPVICGVHSAEEMDAALLAGADALKLYPSETRFGPTHMRETRAALPDTRLFPVGGVTASTVGDFFAAGADAAFLSSCLRDPQEEGPADSKSITEKALEVVSALTTATASV